MSTHMNDSNVIVTNVCRICFQKHNNTISLYSEKDGCSPYQKLVSNTKLNIAVDDGGPDTICGQCVVELNICIEFLAKCDRASKLLLQYKEKHLGDIAEHEDQEKVSEADCIDQDDNDYKISESSEETVKLCKTKSNPTRSSLIKHTCQYCSKVFTRKFNLKLHVARHAGRGAGRGAARARACAACGKTYTTLTNLNTHLRRHNGERPYKCTECGKTFRSSTTLNNHKRIHTGVKPYMCPTCGKRFTTNKLSEHMRTHEPREHACSACGRRFAAARGLREHAAREHAASTGPAPREHACALCGARYSHKQSLNRHLRKRH